MVPTFSDGWYYPGEQVWVPKNCQIWLASQSPAKNPIENLCSILDHKRKSRRQNNIDQLLELLKQGWYTLPVGLLDNLACNMSMDLAIASQKQGDS